MEQYLTPALITIFFGCLAYFLWHKVILMYYRYFYYKSQGIATVGLPIPLLGNSLSLLKHFKNVKNIQTTPHEA